MVTESNVVHLADYRPDPHLVFPTLDKGVHVLPVGLIDDWIKGDKLDALTENPVLLRSIINDWKERALCI